MTGRNYVRKSLLCVLLFLMLFAAAPVFAGTTKTVSLTLRSTNYTVNKPLSVGNKFKLRLSYNDIELINDNVTFKSSRPAVASVSSSGIITGKKAGSAVVSASFNGHKVYLKLTVKGTAASALRSRIVEYAKQFVGVLPYVYAGDSLQSGTDCSGFTHLIMAHFNISAPRSASEYQEMSNITYSDLLPGDIVVYKNGGHVALYVGNDTIIHAKGSNYGTVKESMWYNTPTGYVRVIK